MRAPFGLISLTLALGASLLSPPAAVELFAAPLPVESHLPFPGGAAGFSPTRLLSGTLPGDPGVILTVSDDPLRGPMVGAFITGDVSDEALEARGALIGSRLPDGTRTLRVPLDRLAEVAGTPGLGRFVRSHRCLPFNNLSVPSTGATPGFWTHAGGGTFAGNAGNGVIVGIVDTGIDWNHDDFRAPNGQTRINSIWDQRGAGTPPAGFAYGVEWSAAQINAGTCTHQDTDGHGTHLAGTVVGDGSATGNGRTPFQFIGMAPRADIVVVATDFQTSSIVDGVDYIFQRAAAAGKNAVVVVAAGTQFGPHDGTGTFDTALDALTGPGKILVTAAGNAGSAARHAEQRVPPGAPATITFNLPAYTPNAGATNDFVQIDAYYDGDAELSVTLTSPGPLPVIVGPVTVGNSATNLTSAAGNIRIENGLSTPVGLDHNLFIEIVDSNAGSPPRAGVWTIQLTPVVADVSTELDAWLADFALGTGVSGPPQFTSDVDESELVASPGSALTALSAGAYVTKGSWLSIDGNTYQYPGLTGPGAIAYFSSPGPLRNGVRKPDIAAPGSAIVSSLSAFASVDNSLINPDGKHVTAIGTSTAAAHLAGACALLLSGQPNQGPAQLRQKLAADAVADASTGTVPNARWGVGKLKILNADTQAPLVELLFPNGGQNLAMGSAQVITWTASDNVGVTSITLELSTNNGASYELISSGQANDGAYEWTVPNRVTTQARIRVKALDSVGNLGQDFSASEFTISDQTPPTITLTAPNGGQNFPTGSVQTVSWTASDNIAVTAVTLDYSIDNGASWRPIASGEPNDGNYLWALPAAPAGEVLARVTASDNAGNRTSDASDTPFRISDQTSPQVTLLAPNGGERWLAGSTQVIGWSATDNVGVATVALDYSINAGGSWIPIAVGEVNDGGYSWLVPAVVSDGARVRVTAFDAEGNSDQDASDANFSIIDTTPPTVTVIEPNGGEEWSVGAVQTIRWSAADNVAVTTVRLDVSRNGGSNYATIASGLSNSGRFDWTVDGPLTDQARVRVVVTDASGNSGQDEGDANFRIRVRDETAPTVTLNAPNGGEVWLAGTAQSITWTAMDNVGVTEINLELSSDDGANFVSIATGEANDGSYAWTVPTTATTRARVRVSATDAAGNSANDTSDQTFEIRLPDVEPPAITLLAPNGGETFQVGTTRSITWSATDDRGVTAVRIEYSTNGGSAYLPLAEGETNDGVFNWLVPAAPTTQALVRVTAFDAAGNNRSDTSDAVFTISTPPPAPITVTINTQGSAEAAGFRMVAFPVVPSDLAPAANLQDDLGPPDDTAWRLGTWDWEKGAAGGYRSVEGGDLPALRVGSGYWLLTREARQVDVTGVPVVADTFSVPLRGPVGSWHQVGNPFNEVIPVGSLRLQLTSGDRVPLPQGLRGWSGGPQYQLLGSGASLQRLTGYWIQKTDAAQQRLHFERSRGASLQAAGDDPTDIGVGPAVRWRASVEAHGARGPLGTVEFGAADVTPGEWNLLSRPLPPPPPGTGSGARLLQPDWGAMSGDYEALFQAEAEAQVFRLALPEEADGWPLRLHATRQELPAGMSLSLRDVADGREWRLDPGAAVILETRRRSHLFELRLRPTSDPAAPTPPQRLAATPNPFAASTRFLFAAGVDGSETVVVIDIFDANGRFRRRLTPVGGAGADTELTWDGRDEQGRPVPAGLYYVRVRRDPTGHEQTLRVVRLPGER